MNPKNVVLLTLLLALTASSAAADDVLKWNKTPEAYYMTTAERAEWTSVASPDQARTFIDAFRRKRGDPFLKDIRTRIDMADDQFRLDKTPGSLTERGRVWILIGSPSRSTTNRDLSDSRSSAPNDVFHKLPLSGRGIIQSQWVYDADRLSPELGMTSLTVRFQTDYSRGYETIENPGFVEPYLTRVAELVSNRYAADVQTAQRSGAPPSTTGPDPLWNATPALHGVVFTGDAFLSPTEQPFYAWNLYVPKTAAAFGDWKSALLVTLIRNEAGVQVVARRDPVDLIPYDCAGNRYLDRSVALAPGKYEGMFAAYTPDGTTLLASHRTAFEVPASDVPRATSLMLTSRIDVLETQQPFDPFTFVATKYAVRGDRQFQTSERLAFFTVIANPAGSPSSNLMQKMIFRRDGQDFARTPLEPAQVVQTGPNTFLIGNSFDPETFPAGHYKLELQVRDMNAAEGSELRTRGYVLENEFDVK